MEADLLALLLGCARPLAALPPRGESLWLLLEGHTVGSQQEVAATTLSVESSGPREVQVRAVRVRLERSEGGAAQSWDSAEPGAADALPSDLQAAFLVDQVPLTLRLGETGRAEQVLSPEDWRASAAEALSLAEDKQDGLASPEVALRRAQRWLPGLPANTWEVADDLLGREVSWSWSCARAEAGPEEGQLRCDGSFAEVEPSRVALEEAEGEWVFSSDPREALGFQLRWTARVRRGPGQEALTVAGQRVLERL